MENRRALRDRVLEFLKIAFSQDDVLILSYKDIALKLGTRERPIGQAMVELGRQGYGEICSRVVYERELARALLERIEKTRRRRE